MTSIAFAAGVLPLIFATGVSAISCQEMGARVLGGAIFATILVLFFIPFMYVLIRNLFRVKTVNKVIQINQENEEYSL
jgi:multidrug efflux pump